MTASVDDSPAREHVPDHIIPEQNGVHSTQKPFTPIAICGMACRLPGGISTPQELWEFLLNKGDARSPIPESRYNLSAYQSLGGKPGTTKAEFGYFLDQDVDIGAIDTSFFSMPRSEIERVDPQHRLLLEVAREAVDDAGEINWRGQNIGVYAGSYGQDWYDLSVSDSQKYSRYQVTANHDFMLSNRISYEMDLRGPSLTIRTGCSAALVGLNEACMALDRGDCKSAIVGGTNLVLAPGLTTAMSELGTLNPDGSCKTFSANADGYGRGEAIVAIFVKPLHDALRDGNPVRAVIRGSAVNHDGKTQGVTVPGTDSQEALIRRAYDIADISDLSQTAFFECHGTGTPVGDPIETEAVARVFGHSGIHIGSVKANLGHSEGASGLTSVLKAVLALEHRIIPPQIKSSPPNPAIPWKRGRLTVPSEPLAWPPCCEERVSVNSFGIGGTNAHIILDSASSFGITRHDLPQATIQEEGKSQLLVYSANTTESVQPLVERYDAFLKKNPILLSDVAFTLANRREHLPYRSFVVTNERDVGSITVPTSVAKPSRKSSLVMVFTGQGAQWARMGCDLMESNSVFRDTIKHLDAHLQAFAAPGWTLEEELAKPASTSRVNQAELSQPLCTALQLALVDSLASVGVTPAAVVGHSSGEIAAAYAAGALTREDAIIVAYYRGLLSTRQAKSGAMAALGLSWAESRQFLVPSVVLACDNSPHSSTISGDAEGVAQVVAAVKEARPGALATVLKVDQAYHSHHMVEIGSAYHAAMQDAKVASSAPSKLFFSSVAGALLENPDATHLGPKYWQTNLESPVYFRAAVSDIFAHKDLPNPILVEIGPHSALSGPLRQIRTQFSSEAPIISAQVREQNSYDTFLSLLGTLFTLHVPVDFKSLFSGGKCLGDLPRYPWNHPESHWFETRVVKEWRLRRDPHHDLLGSKIPESTESEPVWRNLFHLENAPWVRDHKIKQDVIFPFAAYVAIAGEAVRQVTGIQDGFSLRKIIVSKAMIVDQEKPTEIITALRQHRLTDTLDSQWWEFSISSHNGHVWTKHCVGEVKAEADIDARPVTLQINLPRRVESSKWYETVRRKGLDYGYHFTCLEKISTSTSSRRSGLANVRNNWHGDEANYHLHPVILDAYFQLLSCAAWHGSARDYRQVLPTSIASLTIFRSTVDDIAVSASADITATGLTGEGLGVAGTRVVLKVSGTNMTPLDDPIDEELDDDIPITARSEWIQHIGFDTTDTLVCPNDWQSSYGDALDEIALLASTICRKSVQPGTTVITSMRKYKAWLDAQDVELLQEDTAVLQDRLDKRVMSLSDTPTYDAAMAISKICANAVALYSGTKHPLAILNGDDTLGKFLTFVHKYNSEAFFRRLGLSTPNLRVLELGAGEGTATADYLSYLTQANGQRLYSQYILSDPSPHVVKAAKGRYKSTPGLDFASLDIGKDPSKQKFPFSQFDLIIASGVLTSTPNLKKSLAHMRTLLSPRGRLLIQETRPGLLWVNYVLGTIPTWWKAFEDARSDGPLVEMGRLEEELRIDGFEIDFHEVSRTNSVLVAKPVRELQRGKITVLGGSATSEPSRLEAELQARGYELCHCTLQDEPTPGQDILALLDDEGPFLDDIDAGRLDDLKRFVARICEAGLFWVTRASQSVCNDPRYAPIIGLARTIRSETAIDFATCETESPQASIPEVADVFDKFYTRQGDDAMGPDLEYSVSDRGVRVNRFFPFSLDDHCDSSQDKSDAVLNVGRPGRLDSLHWLARTALAPQGDQIEMEVHALGLNFRDVLIAIGVLDLPKDELGYEAVGVVRQLGPEATKFKVGDRVCLVGTKTFATWVTDTQDLFVKIPNNLSFIDAATMVLVFGTAIHSLINMGRLQEGQSVLIHSGCGGAGLAAIQIAQMIGAEIYTTVSSDLKATYLMESFGIPRSHIFDSRSTAFVEGIMRQTNNRGVDAILNSLSGELLHATWRCVAKFGTMVEIGKRDILGAGKLDMDMFLDNRNYCCVDIDQLRAERPKELAKVLGSMMEYFRQDVIRPIALAKLASAANVEEAFRFMAQGSHIGKIVIQVRDSAGALQLGNILAPKQQELRLESSASYLLVGGLGGLGRSLSTWMVECGARHLTFLSRSAGVEKRDQEFAHELESMGCSVTLVRGSVTDIQDVSRAVEASRYPLKGIIQMSMVIRDENFSRMSIEDWNGAVKPKIQGTWNLHNAVSSRGDALDFFILFSSLSGILGQPGQANYAAANTFLDAFSRYRTKDGLPCTSIAIGAMDEVGYLTRNEELFRKMKGTGWRPVREAELLNALRVAMQPRAAQTQTENDSRNFMIGIKPTVPLSNPGSSARQRRDIRMSVYHNAPAAAHVTGQSAISADNSLTGLLASIRDDPNILIKPETVTAIARGIGEKLLNLLLKTNQDIDTSIGLSQFGMDSMVAMELRDWWKATFGFKIGVFEIMGKGTLNALGQTVVDRLKATQ
ncbi:hypothetical protein PFICI_02353 [Pestalotiopsis fici W106-1]|uniref:Uncharacterized protein n=1 Tax=Pestalotiopsis fici (strain W106-1 / CGMCC3.15140) TaxID=1229662 RepID=W3XE10_PESFW|nr:uncharacterized protein PFICI_02353 [Pestalotiopsis fici W106-1]ETS84328.1 hypothetical protein PFICI_02353 [Pestalotiopsis fici W106-1]